MDKGSSSSNGIKGDKGSGTSAINNPAKSVRSTKNNETIVESSASAESLSHSNKGEFTSVSKKHISGGHVQESIDFMNKNRIKYEINRVYNNGVRVGNIPNLSDRKMRSGNSHSWLPKDWSESDIKDATKNVLTKHKHPKNGKNFRNT